MRRWFALALALAAVCAAAAALAGQSSPAGRASGRLGKYVIEADRWEGTLGGAWEFSQRITVTAPDIKVTCDRLKVWPTKAGDDIERAEASGNVSVSGRYVASDRSEWQVVGAAQTGVYDAKKGEGVLSGSVSFEGRNQATGAVVSVSAAKLIYDAKSRQFRFEKGAEPNAEPVRVQWEQPPAQGQPPQEGQK